MNPLLKLLEKILLRFTDSFIDSYKRRRDLHDEYLAKYPWKSITQKALADITEAKHFKKETGIYAEGEMRKMFIRVKELTSHACTWKDIKRAQNHIKFDKDHGISIKIGGVDEGLYYMNKTAGYIMGCLLAIAVLYADNTGSIEQLMRNLFLIITLMYIMCFSFQLTWPVMSAKKIQRALR